jgi:hypothetical protein
MDEAPRNTVDLDWLLGHLQKRTFGLLLLILAIAILLPGLGIVGSVANRFSRGEDNVGPRSADSTALTHQMVVCDGAFHPLGGTVSALPQARRMGEPLAADAIENLLGGPLPAVAMG